MPAETATVAVVPRGQGDSYRLPIVAVLNSGISSYTANLVPFSGIALLVYSPAILLGAVAIFERSLLGVFLALFAAGGQLLGPLASGAVIYGVFRRINGKPVAAGACVSTGLRKMLPLLGVTLLSWVFLGGILLAFGALGIGLGAWMGKGAAVLMIIPGLVIIAVLSVAMYLAAPAVVVESLGPMAAIRRSFDLTRGNRWRIWGVIFVIALIQSMANGALGTVFKVLGGGSSQTGEVLVPLLLGLVFLPIQASALAHIYYRLKVGREGADETQLASVFD